MGDAPSEVKPGYKHRPGGETMRALAWFGAEKVQVIDAPIPDITQDDDIILKVTGTTICGTHFQIDKQPGALLTFAR